MSGTRQQLVIVTGSREWADWRTLCDNLDRVTPGELWTGDARGADAIATAYAALTGLPLRTWPADWGRLGKSAGVRRSRDMIDAAPPSAVVLAFAPFPLSASRGTNATVQFAAARRLLAYHIDADGRRRCVSTPTGGIIQ